MKAIVTVVFHHKLEIEPEVEVVEGETPVELAGSIQRCLSDLLAEYVDTKGGADFQEWHRVVSHTVTLIP